MTCGSPSTVTAAHRSGRTARAHLACSRSRDDWSLFAERRHRSIQHPRTNHTLNFVDHGAERQAPINYMSGWQLARQCSASLPLASELRRWNFLHPLQEHVRF